MKIIIKIKIHEIRWRGVFLHKYIYNLLSLIIDHTLIHLWLLFLWIKQSFIAAIFISIYNVCRKSNTTYNFQLSKWYCITICTSWNIYFRVNIILRLWIERISSWALAQNMASTRIHIKWRNKLFKVLRSNKFHVALWMFQYPGSVPSWNVVLEVPGGGW